MRFLAKLNTAKVKLQLDIGFGDIVYPKPEKASMPTILNYPSPRLNCYNRESTIAEKLEAIIKLGELNSRMKDFYDIWLLSRQFDFNYRQLCEAIRKTMKNRGTKMPEKIPAFTESFIRDKSSQWRSYRKKLNQETMPENFSELIVAIKGFLEPVIDSIRAGEKIFGNWEAPDS